MRKECEDHERRLWMEIDPETAGAITAAELEVESLKEQVDGLKRRADDRAREAAGQK
jgi:acetaldehyde dehydrogenase (acetylating)